MIKIHVTDIPTYLNCQRKFFFSQIERLKFIASDEEYRPVQTEHNAFDYGTAVHACLERWYQGEEYHSVLNSLLTGEDLEMARNSLEHYEQTYASDRNWIIHAIEQPFHYRPFPEFDIELVGRFDLLKVSDRRDYFDVVDHKTFSMLPSETDLSVNPQFTAYIWLANRLGYKCESLIYNGLRKTLPSKPLILKSGELSRAKKYLDCTTYNLYEMTIDALGLKREDYKEELDYLANKPPKLFYRTVLTRTKHQLDDFEKNLYNIFCDIKNKEKNMNAFYPNFGYQCNSCQYYPLCDWNNRTGSTKEAIRHYYEIKPEDAR